MHRETGDLVTGRQAVTLHTLFVHELNLTEHHDHKAPSKKSFCCDEQWNKRGGVFVLRTGPRIINS